ncbi:MAG TPA: DUF3105 domain-containing protein [Opitutales bacterium]|nr:DUF3105 domain-containing protein [Opitutales bacterium]
MEQNQSQQLSKQERRELHQQEKQKLQEGKERKRAVKKITIWTIVVLVIVGSVYGLYYLASQPEKPRPGETFSILGQEHISVGASHPAYNSNPPTSGWHYVEEATWGVHQTELPDEQLIHNLEHGGIWISYLGVDDPTKSALEKIAKSQSKVVIEPRAKNDSPIILASWGRLLKLEKFDEQSVLDFIKANRNQSPEPFAQ